MGEPTEFNPGDSVPNNGDYIETGENYFPMGINNPRKITLEAGDEFPKTANKNRKWTRVPKPQ
jgi:hypothetical protein